MTMNGHHNETAKPTSDELRRWAKAPEQPQQPLITESEFTPEEAKQPRPLSGNPVIKIALVAGMMLPIFAVAGLLLNANHPSQAPKEVAQSAKSNNDSETSDVGTAAKQREELGHTQAELAIANQSQALKNQPALKQAPTPKIQPSKETTAPVARSVVSPAPSVSYAPPAPRIIQPPVARSIAPVSPPVADYSSVAAQSSKSRSQAASVQTSPQDSYDRYLAMTQLGSYGQVSSEAANNQTESPAQASTVSAQPEMQPTSETTLVATQPVSPQVKPDEEASILAEQPQRSILAATKAEGILTTPIAADQSKAQDDKFTIQLTQPIKAEDGSIALPSGTQLIAQVNSIAETG